MQAGPIFKLSLKPTASFLHCEYYYEENAILGVQLFNNREIFGKRIRVIREIHQIKSSAILRKGVVSSAGPNSVGTILWVEKLRSLIAKYGPIENRKLFQAGTKI